MSSRDFSCVSFAALSTADLYRILALRAQVFIVEQECAYLDIDGIDHHDDVFHLSAVDEAGQLTLYARLIGPDTTQMASAERAVSIGRVICAPAARGCGLGSQLIQRAIIECRKYWPGVSIRLSAQAHLTGFYSAQGFESEGTPYDEDGIPHILMRLADNTQR